MVKEETKSTYAKSLFSGKASGMTFDKFDEKVLSWSRKTFGEKYVRGLWRNTLLNISYQDLADEHDKFKFEEHCKLLVIYDVIFTKSPKYADSLLGTTQIESKKFQMELRERYRERLFCHLETLTAQERGRNNGRNARIFLSSLWGRAARNGQGKKQSLPLGAFIFFG
jgi:hypothetical protein